MKTDAEALEIITTLISGIYITDLTKTEYNIANVLLDKGLIEVFCYKGDKEKVYRRKS
jgi:hypothetical protein